MSDSLKYNMEKLKALNQELTSKRNDEKEERLSVKKKGKSSVLE